MSRSPERVRYDVIAERVGEVLHYVWDPIGTAKVPQARDEYDSYVPLVVQMLIDGKKKKEISQYLQSVEVESMGLTVDSARSQHDDEVAETLIAHYEWLEKRG